MPVSRIYDAINNYIYLYHTDTLLVIPTYPENLNDQNSASFQTTTPLGRSAPIFSYSYSGPRTIAFDFELHRDMMYQANQGASNAILQAGDDYVDEFIKQIQAAALPVYAASEKMIDPPMVAVRMSNDVFIKGIINGTVGVDFKLPINREDRYTRVAISFTVTEVEPFDAYTVAQIGSFRNTGEIYMDTSLDKNTFVSGAGDGGQRIAIAAGGSGMFPGGYSGGALRGGPENSRAFRVVN